MTKLEEIKESDFFNELKYILNRYCKENESNTPDYILANYLCRCLENYNLTVIERDKHCGYTKLRSEAI